MRLNRKYKDYLKLLWSYKTELIAGNSDLIYIIKGQSAANLLVKNLEQVQRLVDETISIFGEANDIEYNSTTNARHQELPNILDEDIVRTI